MRGYVDLVPLIRRVTLRSRTLELIAPFKWSIIHTKIIGLIRDRLDFLSAEDKELILRKTAEDFLT